MSPLVSVIIPSYNHSIFIEDCLQSLLDVTYDNIEVLIIDDCSTDNTFALENLWKERLEKRFSRVEILKNESNLGVCKTLNRLVELSRGKYIFNLASDDGFVSDGIEKLVCYYEKNQENLVIYSNVALIHEQTHYPFKDADSYELVYNEDPPSGNGLLDQLFQGCFISAPGVIFLRKTFEEIGLFNENLMFEDWEFWLRASMYGSIGYVNEISAYYRINSNSISHLSQVNEQGRKKTRRYIETKFKILETYKEFVSNHEAKKRGFENLCNYSIDSALNTGDVSLAKGILDYARKNRLELSFKYTIKYNLLRLGLLKIIRIIRRKVTHSV